MKKEFANRWNTAKVLEFAKSHIYPDGKKESSILGDLHFPPIYDSKNIATPINLKLSDGFDKKLGKDIYGIVVILDDIWNKTHNENDETDKKFYNEFALYFGDLVYEIYDVEYDEERGNFIYSPNLEKISEMCDRIYDAVLIFNQIIEGKEELNYLEKSFEKLKVKWGLA